MDPWLDMAAAACAQAGLAGREIGLLKTWETRHSENAVFRVGADWYLKIYGPPRDWRFATERKLLEMCAGLAVHAAPSPGSWGTIPAGWPYLFLAALPGEPMDRVWDGLSPDTRLALAGDLGVSLAAVHHLPGAQLQLQEQQLGLRDQTVIMNTARQKTGELIKATSQLPLSHREALLRFLYEEAPVLLAGSHAVTHFDLSHHHVYLAQHEDGWRVSGMVDWSDAILGPAEWDWVCLWHWTFNGVWQPLPGPDWEAMQACLEAYFGGASRPDRLARRCLAAHLLSPWFDLLWPVYLERRNASQAIVKDMAELLFAPQVFGPPD